MPFRPVRRLCALTGALLLGTLGLGMTPATAVPEPAAPPSATAPAAPSPSAPSDGENAERISVIVMLQDQPTTLSTAGESTRLQDQQALVQQWADSYGLEVDRQFGYLLNGFSATIPAEQMSALGLEPEVASVRRERVYERTEHTARQLEGVPTAFAEHGVDGTGTVVSVIDSGLDPSHPDMRLDDCDDAAIQEINPAPEAGFTCKIPSGYNYADESYVIKDSVTEAHGQHVGGIVAANGSEGDRPGDVTETGRIDGVAPNAQLLAMKVFSNSGGGAADADIVAAVEDSVKLGSDVINMSLGSPNGHKNASDAASIAIEAARDAGVITVIAAGNDGQNFSPTAVNTDALGLHDDGTVGAPGTQGSALTVASLDNSVLTQLMAYVNGSEDGIGYTLATGSPDDREHPIVDLGRATAEDVAGRDLDGAYALIERGEITFTQKYENAISAGAGGIVIFNNVEGTFAMAGVETFTVPGIVISRADGQDLREEIAAGETTLRITDGLEVTETPGGLTPSAFTSWGATSSLDFEPEISGIGGNVYSTYNDGTYGMSSGTSMASPNVAGLSALIVDHLAEARPDVTGAQRVDLATVKLMNTAEVPLDASGVAYSPRRIGAGLARVDRALESSVTATVDGDGAAELREIDGSATFTITLANAGDAEAGFSVPAGQAVLAETNVAGEATTTRESSGTATTTKDQVSVPAGGTATLEVTITPESGSDHFVGGWIELISAAPDQPDLSLPYLGFAGEWNAEPIVLPADQDLPVAGGLNSQLVTGFGGQQIPLDGAAGEFWLSPNGDGDMDTIAPSLVLMRNATEVRYEVLDAEGEVVQTIGQEQNLYRTLLSDYTAVQDPGGLLWQGAAFDGLAYDPEGAEFAPLPDGRYTYRVSARLSEEQPWQSEDFGFGIDATAPEIEFGALEQGLLTFTVTEDGSGLLADPTVTAASGEEIPVVASDDGTYAIEVDPEEVPFVTASVLDGGMNLGVASTVFADSTLVVAGAEDLEAHPVGPRSLLVEDGQLLVDGYVSDDIDAVRVAGETVAASEGRFRASVPLTEGGQEIPVEALDADGEVLTSRTLDVTYDSQPPQLEIADMATDEDGRAVLDEDGTITVSGTVEDEREDAELTVTAGDVVSEVAADGGFEITVEPAADAASFALVASDGPNRSSTAVEISGRAQPPAPAQPVLTNPGCSLELSACDVPGDSPHIGADGTTYTINGEYTGGGTVTVTPEGRFGDDGSAPVLEPITVDIAADGTFAADVPVTTGMNGYRLEITDASGRLVHDGPLTVYFDTTAPTLQVTEPTLVGGTLFAPSEEVTVAGTAADDGWGYALSLNGSVVLERLDWGSPGEQSNTREFSAQVQVADGDTLLVEHGDPYGNTLLGLIPVVLDTEAPAVDLDGLDDGARLPAGTELPVAAEDENLASLTVSVDGRVVDEQSTTLASQEHSLEDALIDVRDLGAEGEVAASGLRTTALEDRLETVVAASDLPPGDHVVSVTSTDLAGNTTTETRSLTIRRVLGIDGPDAVEIEVPRETLGDRAALADLVLDGFEATLDGDAGDAAAAGASLSLAAGTVLTAGAQEVTVLARDEEGRSAEQEVTVTVALASFTLSDGDVTATATFRSDDALTAELSADGEDRRLEISNREGFAALDAVITVPGTEGAQVVRALADGREVPVSASWADGTLTFEGPSRATYRILAPAGSGDPGGGDGGSGGSGDGSDGDGSGDGADGDGTDDAGSDGDGSDGSSDHSDDGGTADGGTDADDADEATAGSRGPLARTGTEVYGVAVAASALVIAGGALLVSRRRH